MAQSSWTYKDDPDLTDLIAIMSDEERKEYGRGFATPGARDDFLLPISARWRRYREAYKRRPKSDSDNTLDTFDETIGDLRSGLSELYRRLQTGELVDTTVTPLPPTPHPKQPSNTVGWLAVGFALLERALDVIGFQNLFVGGGLFVAAFVCFCVWFVRTERAARWKFRVRVFVMTIAALLYFPFFGYQLYKQYRTEAVTVQRTTAPLTTANKHEPPQAVAGREFVDIEPRYFATLYRTHSTAQADIAAQGYIGKWVKVGGKVSDVTRHKSLDTTEAIHVILVLSTDDSMGMYAVSARFNKSPNREAAAILNREEFVTVVGKIRGASSSALLLEECEIVPEVKQMASP